MTHLEGVLFLLTHLEGVAKSIVRLAIRPVSTASAPKFFYNEIFFSRSLCVFACKMMIKSSEGGIISVLPVAHRGKLPVVAELAIDVVVLPWGNQHITTLHFSLAGLLFSYHTLAPTYSLKVLSL